MKILIIIPAYNEENTIETLLKEIQSLNIKGIQPLVINDCSTDHTSYLARQAGAKVIDLPCNLGIGGAVQTGYKYALKNGYDIAIQVDGDGQHDPKYIPQLIEPLLNGEADIVIGSRYIEKVGFQSTFLRRLGINYFCKLIQLLTKIRVTDPTSGFRACNKKVIKLLAESYPKDYPEPESIVYLNRFNCKVAEIPVVMRARAGGVSSINLNRSIYYMFKVSLAIIIDRMRKSPAN